jgi:3D (Asp-Asp-Asp) domain-containing protein
MTKLVRGGVLLSMIGMFAAIFDAQTETAYALNIANDSQLELSSSDRDQNTIKETEAIETDSEQVQDKNKKGGPSDSDKGNKVEKTVSSRAIGMSRGAFTATAYCLKGRTAMGHGVRKGIIAADPRVLPLGSRISLDGGYSGTYLVSDTGGRIKGKKLDIWMASCAEARRFGRRTVSVNYLGR